MILGTNLSRSFAPEIKRTHPTCAIDSYDISRAIDTKHIISSQLRLIWLNRKIYMIGKIGCFHHTLCRHPKAPKEEITHGLKHRSTITLHLLPRMILPGFASSRGRHSDGVDLRWWSDCPEKLINFCTAIQYTATSAQSFSKTWSLSKIVWRLKYRDVQSHHVST